MIYVSNLGPQKVLQFIDERINDNSYRGNASSEHNRYDMQEIYQTLIILNKYAPNGTLIRIRDTDTSKRPANTPEEYQYATFCEEVNKTVGKGTQDSIRKNIFVDVNRMGLINRYDKNKELIPPHKRSSVKYVSLSDEGLKFINEKSLLNRSFIFTKAVDVLLEGHVEVALQLLQDPEYGIKQITKYDFILFVSAVDVNADFRIDLHTCAEYIKSFNGLGLKLKTAVIDTLKEKLMPDNFKGDKTVKRDWHNWKNKIDQIYCLLKDSPHFNVDGDNLLLSTREITTKSGEVVNIMARSIEEKRAYFDNHKVKRTAGFELHHVVPLSWAESPEQYKLFDKWENMVYIDAYRHAIITQNRNRNIEMRSRGNDVLLIDHHGNAVELIFDQKNILYDPANQPTMLRYNKELRDCL